MTDDTMDLLLLRDPHGTYYALPWEAVERWAVPTEAVGEVAPLFDDVSGFGPYGSQVAQAKNKLDSLSEMGEMESLRLQMAMDRTSKFMSTLSNMLLKMSDTSTSITQNMR
jgi:hypothetical protein